MIQGNLVNTKHQLGNGDQLDRHAIVGSLDKKDKAIEHDILLGDEKVPGGMDYVQ